jgi:hypothetical protein
MPPSRRALSRRALSGVALATAFRAAHAATAVDLALVLAVDASGSVNRTRFELQQRGYATAFRNPRVIAAIGGGALGGIAVAMTQWTGPQLHVDVVPWRLVADAAGAEAAAAAIEASRRALFGGGTSISGAIAHGWALLAACPFEATRRVIDVSGDGANNRGRPAAEARDEAVAAGITINGLPIPWLEPDLEESYRREVIGGAGAFVVVAESYEAFGTAIVNKLVAEIAQGPAAWSGARS